MLPTTRTDLLLPDETWASRFGAALATEFRQGVSLLLEGPVGAGKSHIARAAIRALCGAEIEVPSPTFTLVQTYDGPECEIWHTDLYRLTDPDEVIELGLVEALETAITLIEWPDRLGPYVPADAWRLRLVPQGDARLAVLDAPADVVARVRKAMT